MCVGRKITYQVGPILKIFLNEKMGDSGIVIVAANVMLTSCYRRR